MLQFGRELMWKMKVRLEWKAFFYILTHFMRKGFGPKRLKTRASG